MKILLALLMFLSLLGPVAAQDRVARVGYLLWQDSGPFEEGIAKSFIAGLRDEGFVEGRNLMLERRAADYDPRRFPAFARDLSAKRVDVVFAPAMPMATAAWRADRSTPIVIATILDPVALKFVNSLARPGTRVTGVTTMTDALTAKRMQLLMEIVPGLKRVGVIIDERLTEACPQEVDAMNAAAAKLGLTLVYRHFDNAETIDAVFRKLSQTGVQAVTTTMMSTRFGLAREYADAALKYRLPSMYEFGHGPGLGGLISYGPDLEDVYRRAGHYAGRILKGGNPAEMPMEQPREFKLRLNLRTAKLLGIAIPQSVLLRADEVIQ